MFSLASMTVRNSMLMFVAIAAAGALALPGVAFKQGRDSEALADRLLIDVQLARSAGTADMMHDGLRATTLSARLAGPSSSDADKQAIRTELAEFSKNFDDSLAIVRELAEGETAAALAEVTPTVQRYGQTAAALVEAALTDTAQAEPLVAGFDTDFSTLEQRLDALRGLIEKAAEADIVQRDALFARARNALLLHSASRSRCWSRWACALPTASFASSAASRPNCAPLRAASPMASCSHRSKGGRQAPTAWPAQC